MNDVLHLVPRSQAQPPTLCGPEETKKTGVGRRSPFAGSLGSHVGLQLIEGIVLVFGNELWAVDGQLLVGIH